MTQMPHRIPSAAINRYTAGPSATTTASVASFQEAIRDALGSEYETFLQGSYRNDTSIRDINDVDVVAVQKTTVSTVFSQERYPTSVTWNELFGRIEARLGATPRFAGKVRCGDKCVKVSDTWNADVVPAVRIQPDASQDPIAIYSFSEARERQNWPRVHYRNGVAKQQATGGRFKPSVRVFKNWAANHWPQSNAAPSFYLECLVSNVPDDQFIGDGSESFFMTGHWITQHLPPRPETTVMSVARDKDILCTSEWSFEQYGQFFQQLVHSLGLLAQALQASSEAEALRLWRLVFNE